jgi:hypothetical protein
MRKIVSILLCLAMFASQGQAQQAIFRAQNISPDSQTITVVQACPATNQPSSVTSTTITCTSNFTAGNTIVVFVGDSANGGTWTGTAEGGADTLTCASPGSGQQAYCIKPSIVGGGNSVVINSTNTSFGVFIVFELHNTATSSAIDASTLIKNQTATPWNGDAVTIANGSILFFVGGSGSTNATYTAGSGYTLPANSQSSGGGQSAFAEYQIF